VAVHHRRHPAQPSGPGPLRSQGCRGEAEDGRDRPCYGQTGSDCLGGADLQRAL